MPLLFPRYNITYADWNDEKEKKTPSTGVGEALKKATKAYEAINLKAIDAVGDARGPAEVKEALPKAEEELPNITAFQKALKNLIEVIEEAIKKAKKDDKFPEKSLELLQKLSKNAAGHYEDATKNPPKMFAEAVNSVNDYESRRDKVISELKKLLLASQNRLEAAEKQAVDLRKIGKYISLGEDDLQKVNQLLKGASSLNDAIKVHEKDNESALKDWRVNSEKLISFISKTEQTDLIVPITKQFMLVNKEIIALSELGDEVVKQCEEARQKLI